MINQQPQNENISYTYHTHTITDPNSEKKYWALSRVNQKNVESDG
jgi:hypothetical protein